MSLSGHFGRRSFLQSLFGSLAGFSLRHLLALRHVAGPPTGEAILPAPAAPMTTPFVPGPNHRVGRIINSDNQCIGLTWFDPTDPEGYRSVNHNRQPGSRYAVVVAAENKTERFPFTDHIPCIMETSWPDRAGNAVCRLYVFGGDGPREIGRAPA